MGEKTPKTLRDDFSRRVKETLAARVAFRCSNPDCSAVTAGPKLGEGGAVNLGVAAHITAASPGGPRYDPALTSTERSAEANGLWLCQNCGKLIDSDVTRYTVQTLCQWKVEAEQRALVMLRSGARPANEFLELALPKLDAPESLLAFASTAVARVGREREIRELEAFLEADTSFSWWLWTGSAGTGKSRLAIELCRAKAGEWHAGFLREDNQRALADLQPTRPTLAVVDYAAQRGEWLSDALFRLSQRVLSAPVRVLILERQAQGPWWDLAQRTHRMEESFQIQERAYGLPRELGGLPRPQICKLVKAVADQAGVVLSSTHVEDIADHSEKMDPDGRPLFALVAALDWLDGNGVSADRDAALRRLIARMDGQAVQAAAASPKSVRHTRSVQILGTALGGLSVESYAHLVQTFEPPPGLLPDVYSDLPLLPLEDLLDGLRPDMLGELYVLDRVGTAGAERHAAMALLKLAWQKDQKAYRAFVERAVGDHREHPGVVDLLDAGDWAEAPATCADMAVTSIPLLQRSDHPVLDWIFSRLQSVQESTSDGTMDELIVNAHFRRANLVLNEGDAHRANDIYSKALALCAANWKVYAGLLNNRGISWYSLGAREAARADFTAVAENLFVDDESRACAFNNRADIFDDNGDVRSAVRDRTAVLELAETTYNRRFIAHIRRALALRKSGDPEGAYGDIESILDSADIIKEQKMSARLKRAEWLVEDGEPAAARIDVEAVLASERNFDSVENVARELLLELSVDAPSDAGC
ncbi:tetratricopeptide repeat protein [Streptomyces brasiliensis]|uniref:Tetratricopeptide repeat protein n=1 Tax=Streptomyces brasiliensis TaxID=1954 RepID=A0A917NX00_9ACTN|nr:hypothetical protein [Streptomyces brasiliensis]GGJ36749.1 hypothetical protein GCM10010121_054970 [Streptomyces brasiliensis]